MGKRLKEIFREDSCYKVFFAALVIAGLGYGVYKGVLDNYLAEVVGMGEMDRGITEFFREMPGLLLVLVLAVFYSFSAEKMYKLGAACALVGMIMISVVPPVKALVILSMFMFSMGEHIQLGMENTLALNYAKPGKGGEALGHQKAMYQAGTLAGYALVVVFFAIFAKYSPFKVFFMVSAVILLVGFYFAAKLKGSSETDESKRRFYFRKKYSKYYMLEVFYGARKQVFITFGPYVLILLYGASATVISLLFAVSAICSYFFAPKVGKIIDRFGYKIVMISDTLILVIVCFFYGFSHHLFPENIAFIICCLNYVLDSIISLASMASNVYVQDLSDNPDEMRATISTGVSVNHLISIIIALFGGWIWHTIGVETLFMVSAALGLCNSAYAATVNAEKDRLR